MAKAKKTKVPKPQGPTLMNPQPKVDPSTQAPQGGSPSLPSTNNRHLPQFEAPMPPAVYYLTLEQAEDTRSVLIADGAIPDNTEIWENGLEIGFGGPSPAPAKRGVGAQCLSLRWRDPDGRPAWQEAGIVYYHLLEMRSSRTRLGNPIPRFVRTESGIVTS